MAEVKVVEIAFGDTFNQVVKLSKSIEELAKQRKDLAQAVKDGVISEQESANGTELLTRKITQQTKERQTLRNVIDQTAKAVKDEVGSISANRAELSKLTAEYIKIGKPTKDQTDKIKKLSDTLKEQEGAIGDNRRSVGGYADAISKSIPALGNVITGVKGFNTALKANPVGAIVGLLLQFGQALQGNAKVADFVTRILAGLNKAFQLVIDTVINLQAPLKAAFDNPRQALLDLVELIQNNLINRFKALGVIVNAIADRDLKGLANGLAQFGSGVEDVIGKVQGLGGSLLEAGADGFNAAKKLDEFVVTSARLGNEIAKNEQIIKAETFALKDRTKTEQQRIVIAEKIAALEVENATKSAERAQQELEAEQLRLKGKTLSAQEEAKLSDLATAVELANSEKLIAQQQKQTRINILLDKEEKSALKEANKQDTPEEIAAREKKAADTIVQAKKEALAKRLSDSKIYFDEQTNIEKENYANGLINEQEYQDRIKQLKVDSLSDQLDILQTSGEAIQEKEIELQGQMLDNEIAHIQAIKDENIKQQEETQAINEKQYEDFKATQEAKFEIANQVTGALGSLITIFGKQSAEAAAFSKLLAIAQIGIDTAKSISAGIAGATTSATATGPGAFAATPIFIATTIATILAAVAQATAILKKSNVPKAPKFAEGGGIDIEGAPHSQGGTEISADGKPIAIAERGEKLFVLKKSASEQINRLSQFNQLFGGASWTKGKTRFAAQGGQLNDGGFAFRSMANDVNNQIVISELVTASIKSMPQQVVKVIDINRVQRDVQQTLDVSSL